MTVTTAMRLLTKSKHFLPSQQNLLTRYQCCYNGRNISTYNAHKILTSNSNNKKNNNNNRKTNINLNREIRELLVTNNNHTDIIFYRSLHNTAKLYGESSKPSSKVEESVQAIKEKEKEVETKVVVKKTIREKVWDELVHYYHGFRLLFIDINVSMKLLWRVLNGNHLTRREHNLLVRTVSDMFRLVPFSVFIIVPFMELLLPVFIKFFPGMLPSTFQTTKDKDNKLKQSLKIKLEMAKFLQETLDNMTLKASGHSSEAAKQFAIFFEKVRSEGGLCSSEEIMKFSKLFEDEITLDSLPRPQLVALCRVLELKPMGTSNFLRFQLRMKLRSLAADDVVIQKEGVDSLTLSELQQACRTRGMRAYGLSEERLRFQLSQWLDLSLNKKVPPSLLLLSRAFMLPETIPTMDKLKATISALPDTVAVSTRAAIGEREGKVDNKTKIEIIKEEERRIQEEREETAVEMEKMKKEEQRLEKEMLLDTAPGFTDKALNLNAVNKDKAKEEDITPEDVSTLDDAVNVLASEKKSLVLEKEELEDLREELEEYKEDVDDLNKVMQTSESKEIQLKETRAAKRLFKNLNRMITKMNVVVENLEQKETKIKSQLGESSESDEILRIDELIGAIRKIQKVPDDSKLQRITEVLSNMDEDHDGAIRVDTVVKVLELIGEENVKLSPNQIKEVIELLEKEEALEIVEQAEEELQKNGQPISKEGLKKLNKDKLNIGNVPPVAIPPTDDKTKSNSKTL